MNLRKLLELVKSGRVDQEIKKSIWTYAQHRNL